MMVLSTSIRLQFLGLLILAICGSGCQDFAPIPENSSLPNPEPAISDTYKMELMKKYAPYTYMAEEEKYFPSTVEFAFPYFKRYKNEDNGYYTLTTKEKMIAPDHILGFFHGDLTNTQIYTFWVEKNNLFKNITYFYYYPYNEGKEEAGIFVSNHVSDWEHATVRLKWKLIEGDWELVPYEMYLSQHSTGETRSWDQVQKIEDSPVIYAAKGSHGMYFEEGTHQFVDVTSRGRVLVGSPPNRIVPFDYSTQRGLNGNNWPNWMSSDYTTKGSDPSTDPASGPIHRWGNKALGCVEDLCLLSAGPTGPVAKKNVWDPTLFEQ